MVVTLTPAPDVAFAVVAVAGSAVVVTVVLKGVVVVVVVSAARLSRNDEKRFNPCTVQAGPKRTSTNTLY